MENVFTENGTLNLKLIIIRFNFKIKIKVKVTKCSQTLSTL